MKWAPRAAPWILTVLVVVAMGRVVGSGIAPIDDGPNIFNNPLMNSLTPPQLLGPRGISGFWTHSIYEMYVPVTYTLWLLLAKATWLDLPDPEGQHLDPHVFHLVSLLLHVINTLLVYALLCRLLRARRIESAWPALGGALLFGLHPLQVESVAWIVGMRDLLYCGFALAALLAYTHAAEISTRTPRVKGRFELWSFYVGGIVLMIVGMLCKPTAMVVPLLALVVDHVILQRQFSRAIAWTIPYLIAAIPLMIVAKILQPAASIISPPLWQRPVVALASLTFYLWKLLLPLRLGFDYGWQPTVMLHKQWFWYIEVIPVVLGIILFRMRGRQPWLWAGALIAVAALLPTLGLTPFIFQRYSTVADHYALLAMFGPALMAAGLIHSASASQKWLTRIVIGSVAAILGALSFLQLGHWQTPELVLRQILKVCPDSALAWNNLGTMYLQQGDLPKAEASFLATQINPIETTGTQNLARFYAAQGEPEKSLAAFDHLLLIVSGSPPAARLDLRNEPLMLMRLSIQYGHWREVPRYLPLVIRMWFGEHLETWLGGPTNKFLPGKGAPGDTWGKVDSCSGRYLALVGALR